MRGERDVARLRSAAPDLELGEFARLPSLAPALGAGRIIAGETVNDELQVTGLDRRKSLVRAIGVDLRARGFDLGESGAGTGFDGDVERVPFPGELGELLVQRLDRRTVGAALFRRGDDAASMSDAFERGAQPVVVLGRDGIELVVVAARAVDGQAEEGAAGRGDHVVERGRADVGLAPRGF